MLAEATMVPRVAKSFWFNAVESYIENKMSTQHVSVELPNN